MTDSADDIHDQWLVLRTQGGDADAFTELFRRWAPRIRRHAGRMLGSPDDAQDAAQEAWVSIARGIGRLGDPALFRRWAYRIATRRCADQVRKQQRRRRAESHIDPADGVTDPSASEGDDVERLRAAIRSLPPERRMVLTLLYTDGLSVVEIAAALEIPTGTVKSRLRLAREELRRRLDRSETEGDQR